MDRSPGFGSTACNYFARLDSVSLRLRISRYLTLLHTITRWPVLQKVHGQVSPPIACKHKVSGSFSLPSRGPFHLSLTVLFSIGHWVVFRLGGWAPLLQTGFHVSGPTLDSTLASHTFQIRDFYPLWLNFPVLFF